jgi:hypothetical protein
METQLGEGFTMKTFLELPNPDVCKTEKLAVTVDFWSCLVEEADCCLYLLKMGTTKICSIGSRSGTRLKRKIEDKKVYVRYPDASQGVVPRVKLDELIESGRIIAFERSSGWVDINKDPIRRKCSQWQFKGLQRRARW